MRNNILSFLCYECEENSFFVKGALNLIALSSEVTYGPVCKSQLSNTSQWRSEGRRKGRTARSPGAAIRRGSKRAAKMGAIKGALGISRLWGQQNRSPLRTPITHATPLVWS